MQKLGIGVLLLQLFWTSTRAQQLERRPNQRPVCPRIVSTTQNTRLQSSDPVKNFNEISGLALSPTQTAPSGDPLLFGINDGGGGERLGMFNSATGRRLLTLKLPINVFPNKDWESMTIGSCGSTGVNRTCLYIADIGDNTARSSNGSRTSRNATTPYRILKMKEPVLKDFSATNNVIPMSYLSILTFNYLDPLSPTRYADCEAMFLDHTGWGNGGRIGDLYLVTKWDENKKRSNNRLFKIPASAWPSSMGGSRTVAFSPKAVGRYNEEDGLMQNTWTEADATFDGTLIALGTMYKNYVFLRCPGATVAETLTAGARPCLRWNSPSPGQVETISFSLDATQSINIPEGNNKPLGWTILMYDRISTSQTCPRVQWVIATVREGQQVRYCRAEDGTSRPPAWCQDVKDVVYLSSNLRGSALDSVERAGEEPIDPVEETLSEVAEENETEDGT